MLNVRFLPRTVKTRDGLTKRMTSLTASFIGLNQFIDNNGNKTLLALDSNGILNRQDPATGVPVAMSRGLAVCDPGSMMTAWTIFGRIFLGFYNDPNATPTGVIRHWDGLIDKDPGAPPNTFGVGDSGTAGNASGGAHNLYLVFEMANGLLSQASAPVVWNTAGGKSAALTTVPLGPAGCVARWFLITTVAGPKPYLIKAGGQRIPDNISVTATINFPSDANIPIQGYDATFLLSGSWVPTLPHLSPEGPTTSLVAPMSAADTANAGAVVAGVHQVQVVFETRWGYLTVPGSLTSWTAGGGKTVLVSNIPIGPWYVQARRLIFTVSSGASFYYISVGFRIADNTTTSFEVNFSDVQLLQGSNVDYLSRNISVSDAFGLGNYNLRLTLWGELNNLRNAIAPMGLSFDSGFDTTSGLPNGWNTLTVPNAFGGSKEMFDTWAGESWKMVGDGFHPIIGEIGNSNFQTLLALGAPYTISVRIKGVNANLAAPSDLVEFALYVPNTGMVLSSFTVPINQLSNTNYLKFEGNITNGLSTTYPSGANNLFLRIRCISNGGLGVIGNGVGAIVDHPQFYPTNQKILASILRFSNVGDPETIDGTVGLQQINVQDGQKIMACRQLRSFYYIWKERSVHVTVDDGIQNPAFWTVRIIDNAVGCGSPNSLDSTESFLMTASRAGAYIFSGGRPVKVSQEIQTTWERINWQFSDTISIAIDSQKKRIYFLVPIDTSVIPINSLVLDYSEGMGEEEDPGGRKWGFDGWPQALRGVLKMENSIITQSLFGVTPNTQSIYFAGNKIYEHVGADDDLVAIDSFYDTAFLKASDRGQDLYGGAALTIEGNGACQISIRGLDDVLVQLLQPVINLVSGPGFQYELYGEMEVERAKLRIESSALDTAFTLKGATLYAQPWAEVRVL